MPTWGHCWHRPLAGWRHSLSKKSPKDSKRWGPAMLEPQRGWVGLEVGGYSPERAHCESSPVPGVPKATAPSFPTATPPKNSHSSNRCQRQLGLHGPESVSLGPGRRPWVLARRGQVLETVAAPGQALPPPGSSSWSPVPSPTGSVDRTGRRPHCQHWVLPHCIHSMGLGSLGPSRTCVLLAPQPSALAFSPQESRNPSAGLARAPEARLVASPPVTPGGQLRVWPHQLPPPGVAGAPGSSLFPLPVSPAPSEVRRLEEAPSPPRTPGQGSSATGLCCDSLRGRLRGPSARSEGAWLPGGIGEALRESRPAAWLHLLGMREAQESQGPAHPRAERWAGGPAGGSRLGEMGRE